MNRKDSTLLLMAFAFLLPAMPVAWGDDEEPAPQQQEEAAPNSTPAPNTRTGQQVSQRAECEANVAGTAMEARRAPAAAAPVLPGEVDVQLLQPDPANARQGR